MQSTIPVDSSTTTRVSVLQISPYPSVKQTRSTAKKRKAEVSCVLTGTPFKKLLEEKQASRNESSEKKISDKIKCKRKLMNFDEKMEVGKSR